MTWSYLKLRFSATEAKPVPLTTYGTFLFRDSLIIGAGFILPAMVASHLRASTEMDQQKAEKMLVSAAKTLLTSLSYLLLIKFYISYVYDHIFHA